MVKFNLKAFTIQTRPRAGYFVLDNDVIKCVKKVVPQKDKVVFTDETELSIAECSTKVLKFVGEVQHATKTQTYSIVHGDYVRIIADLIQPAPYADDVPEEDRKYATLKDALFDGITISYNGEIDEVLSKVNIDDIVEITSLPVVDRHELYRKEDRLCVVTHFNKENYTYTLKSNSTGINVTCKRKDFVKIQKENAQYMLHLVCNVCGR